MDSVIFPGFLFLDNQSSSGKWDTSLVDWLSYGYRWLFHVTVSLNTTSRQSIKESISSFFIMRGGTNRSTVS
jgi:hypothetical protein